jgi:5-carboxymethyl-2-hydroxymuconate isomerase
VYRLDYSEKIMEDTIAQDLAEDTDTLVFDYESRDEITREMHAFLDSIATLNKMDGYVNGFTIQIYAGRDREEASSMKNKVYRVLPESRPKLIFDAPNFEVKVGQYSTRFEAYRDFAALKNAFPSTIIIPERIKIEN